MSTIDKIWMYSGAVVIAAVASLVLSVGVMSIFVPMPLPMVILAWTLSYGFIFVMPIIYLIEFKLLGGRKNFGIIILITAVLFSTLSLLYFWGSWEYGIKYQGELHTKIVAVENIVGFIGLLVLAYLGVIKKSKSMQYSANLYLFLLLTWCAFPYLGEVP